jgi:hypothetical protein
MGAGTPSAARASRRIQPAGISARAEARGSVCGVASSASTGSKVSVRYHAFYRVATTRSTSARRALAANSPSS